MPELEKQITAWRAATTHALSGDQTVVDELEDHLREQIAALQRGGRTDEDTFAEAVARVGDAAMIAAQFKRARPPRHVFMKTLRIIGTLAFGGYGLAMGLQFVSVSLAVFKDLAGIEPDTHGARTAFFPNLLVCAVCAAAIWAIWRLKRAPRSAPRLPSDTAQPQ